jgi:hypothetical protein
MPKRALLRFPLDENIVERIRVRASRWVRFNTMPGRGTETVHFSLAEYPEHIDRTPPLASVLVGAPLGFSSTPTAFARLSMPPDSVRNISYGVTPH